MQNIREIVQNLKQKDFEINLYRRTNTSMVEIGGRAKYRIEENSNSSQI